MQIRDELRSARTLFTSLSFDKPFEYAVVLVLTMLIVITVASATWHLALAVLALVLSDRANASAVS